ncbi:MAG: aminotransferase class IV [Prolixibacteraceae bacterium]|nr:aminotransferase class IV [Prolixibacteraceae bacterium]
MNIVITNLGFKKESEDLTKFYESDRVVYEVIRIIDGVALFLEDHFGRLLNSMQIQRIRFEMDYIGFKQNISELIRINQKAEAISGFFTLPLIGEIFGRLTLFRIVIQRRKSIRMEFQPICFLPNEKTRTPK